MTDDPDTKKKLDQLREQESTGNRLEKDNPNAQPTFVDALEEALADIEEGEASDTISAYDPKLAAILDALKADDRLDDVFADLQEAYDGNAGLSEPSRSAVIRLAVRVGLQEGTTGIFESLEKAVRRSEETTL